jgi:hypothetical protein
MRASLKRPKTLLLCAGFFAGVLSPDTHAALDLAPKSSIRSGSTLIKNTVSGLSTLSLGGFEVLGHVFLTPKLAMGLGYKAEFDLSNQVVPLKGFEIQGRYYWWGQGTRTRDQAALFSRSSRSQWSAYAAATLFAASYYIATGAGVDPLEGDANMILGAVGIDYALSSSLDLNIEAVMSTLSFSSDPDTVRFSTMGAAAGLTYIF